MWGRRRQWGICFSWRRRDSANIVRFSFSIMVSGLLMSNIATDMLMSLRPKYSKLTLCTRMVLLELWARMKCYGNVSRFKTDGCKSIFVSWIVCSHAYRQCLKDGLQRANASWLIHLGLNAWEPSFLINRVHECVLVLWKGGVTSIVYMAGVKARKLFCPPVTEWQRSENRNRFLSSTFLRCRGGDDWPKSRCTG